MAKTNPAQFFNQVKSEASKIFWPTWPETARTAVFVGILMVVLSLFFLGIDSAFGAIVQWLLSLA
ncbi:MAG TPA: preprotein translocase subunit SecE [Sphingomonadaceae bacterium]|nr:preprotein translocase subunit SecE [Sphingomonadaceae bacterium]